jgi:hypothetical protein
MKRSSSLSTSQIPWSDTLVFEHCVLRSSAPSVLIEEYLLAHQTLSINGPNLYCPVYGPGLSSRPNPTIQCKTTQHFLFQTKFIQAVITYRDRIHSYMFVALFFILKLYQISLNFNLVYPLLHMITRKCDTDQKLSSFSHAHHDTYILWLMVDLIPQVTAYCHLTE